jgi:hypothetical protein
MESEPTAQDKFYERLTPLLNKIESLQDPDRPRDTTRFLKPEDIGKALALFYKQLCENGVPEKLAAELTIIYLAGS